MLFKKSDIINLLLTSIAWSLREDIRKGETLKTMVAKKNKYLHFSGLFQ